MDEHEAADAPRHPFDEPGRRHPLQCDHGIGVPEVERPGNEVGVELRRSRRRRRGRRDRRRRATQRPASRAYREVAVPGDEFATSRTSKGLPLVSAATAAASTVAPRRSRSVATSAAGRPASGIDSTDGIRASSLRKTFNPSSTSGGVSRVVRTTRTGARAAAPGIAPSPGSSASPSARPRARTRRGRRSRSAEVSADGCGCAGLPIERSVSPAAVGRSQRRSISGTIRPSEDESESTHRRSVESDTPAMSVSITWTNGW